MRRLILPAIAVMVFGFSGIAQAESDGLHIRSRFGAWNVNLPNYGRGLNGQGNTAWANNMDTTGSIGKVSVFNRLDSGAALEVTGWLASAQSFSKGAPVGVTLPTPAANINGGAGGESHFVGETWHYGCDAIVRKSYCTALGELTFGGGFSWMRFDQDFRYDFNAPATASHINFGNEELDTDYWGGKLIAGWEDELFGKTVDFRAGWGLYGMDADYNSLYINTATGVASASEFAQTLELAGTTWGRVGNVPVGLTLAYKYLSDMPVSTQPMGAPPVLNTASAHFTSLMIEFLR